MKALGELLNGRGSMAISSGDRAAFTKLIQVGAWRQCLTVLEENAPQYNRPISETAAQHLDRTFGKHFVCKFALFSCLLTIHASRLPVQDLALRLEIEGLADAIVNSSTRTYRIRTRQDAARLLAYGPPTPQLLLRSWRDYAGGYLQGPCSAERCAKIALTALLGEDLGPHLAKYPPGPARFSYGASKKIRQTATQSPLFPCKKSLK